MMILLKLLKAFGVAVGFVVFASGAGLTLAKWDDYPEWLQAVIAILAAIAAIAVLTVLVVATMGVYAKA